MVDDNKRILIVDDNADAADALSMLLRLKGFNVTVAYDGESGLECADGFKPQIALLDIGLPGMSGHELALRLRASGWAQQLLLIAITGWGQLSDREKSREAGFNHHLVKPVGLAELLALFDSHEFSSGR